MRAFAALHVLGTHFALPLVSRDAARLHASTDTSFFHRALTAVVDAFVSFFQCGSASVSLFFVLSGFILAYNYLDPAIVRQTTRRQFWLARFARVYPAFLLAWVVATPAAVNQLWNSENPSSHVKAVLLPPMSLIATHAWVPDWALSWNSPSWSLCTEAFFYLIFPIIFVINRPQASQHSVGSRRRQTFLFFMWMLVAVLIPTLYVALDLDHIGLQAMRSVHSLDLPYMRWLPAISFFPLLRQPELLAGVALGHLFLLDVRENRRLPGWVCPLAVLLVIAAFVLQPVIPYAFYAAGGLMPVFALLIYSLAHGGWMRAGCPAGLWSSWGKPATPCTSCTSRLPAGIA